jgi:hypothetical protein
MKLVKFNFEKWIEGSMKDAYLETGQPVELRIIHPKDEDPLFQGIITFSPDDIVYHFFEFNGTKCEKSFKRVTNLMMEEEK